MMSIYTIKRLLLITGCIFLLAACSHKAGKVENPVEMVNPMLGTDGFGHTFPGATVPFGMVQLSPDTRIDGWEGCSGYHYSDSIIYGFTHTHLSGTGCSDYGDILLMPTTGKVSISKDEYSSGFSHENEKAEAGFYAVKLDKPNVNVELTASKRVGVHKYTFPETNEANIILDLHHRDETLISQLQFLNDSTVCGMRSSKAWAEKQVLYFVAKFSKPMSKKVLYINDSATQLAQSEGKNLKAAFTFATQKDEAIIVKVAISAISVEGAMKNLEAEVPHWDFEATRLAAKEAWNKELKKIEIEGGTEEQQRTFYTSLYHCMISPNLYMDVDGQYRGRDMNIHTADSFNYYTVFSLWDTYRALHPLLSIIDQKRTNDFINTFLCQYQQGGLMPVWELSSCETNCMIGYHSVSVIADAYAKGIRNYNVDLAFEAMKASAGSGKYGLDIYNKFNFILSDFEHESVSKTLEYAYDDWCIAQMAKKLDKKEDYQEYIQRAQFYKNLYNPNNAFIQPKVNGAWLTPFDPTEVSLNYTEANGWQYAFYVPQDIEGLYGLMGGKDVLDKMLDSLFFGSQELSGRNQADITGLIGQYAHGNEPSHHVAYLYNYLGKPWKTQALVRRIMDEMYSSKPDGICGNDDCGQMAAWYVMSAMGFYPVTPGSTEYAIGSPLFDKVTIHLENGKTFTVEAKDQKAKNIYVHSTTLNGKHYNKCFITHEDIMNGGVLKFHMGKKENKKWGIGKGEQPSSHITDFPIVVAPTLYYDELKSFVGSKMITISTIEPNAKIYYTLDSTYPTEKSTLYTKPFNIEQSCTVKAITYRADGKASAAIEGSFYRIPAGRSVKVLSEYSKQYTAGGDNGLIDHIRGTANWRLGSWQGYGEGKDFDAIIDLGSEQEVHYIGAGFIQDISPWIWLPNKVEILTSADGKNFKSVKTIKNTIAEKEQGPLLQEFGFSTTLKTRYIRIKAQNKGIVPDWHISKGEKPWLFVDEIVIE